MMLTKEERGYVTRHARLKKKYLLAPKGEREVRLAAVKQLTTEELRREFSNEP